MCCNLALPIGALLDDDFDDADTYRQILHLTAEILFKPELLSNSSLGAFIDDVHAIQL